LAWNGTFVGSHELLAKGVFQPVEQYIKADKFDTKPYLSASLEGQKFQGQLHGLPFLGHYGCNAIYYNKDMLAKAGVQPPPDFANSATKFEQSQLAIMQQTLGNVATFQLPSSRTHEFKWDVTVIPKGPSGKRGTQGQSTGYALTKLSKNPDSAWEWDKFITNKDNGIEQVFGGGGSPGARTDVWNDPRLLSLSPVFGLMVKVFGQPGPFNANTGLKIGRAHV